MTAVLARGGHLHRWGTRGALEDGALVAEGSRERFPVVREAMRYAPRARAVLTIPGTKCIELAALGVATIVSTLSTRPR